VDGLSRANLLSDYGFEGFDGPFRLRANGQTQRSLAVLQVTPMGVRVVDPAPATFDPMLY